MEWPVAGAIVRAVIAIGGGLLVIRAGVGLGGIFSQRASAWRRSGS